MSQLNQKQILIKSAEHIEDVLSVTFKDGYEGKIGLDIFNLYSDMIKQIKNDRVGLTFTYEDGGKKRFAIGSFNLRILSDKNFASSYKQLLLEQHKRNRENKNGR